MAQSNLRPNIGANGLIHCGAHRDRVAIALQTATINYKSKVVKKRLLEECPIVTVINYTGNSTKRKLHAIFYTDIEKYLLGNASLGLCSECAFNYWKYFDFPPLYIEQRVVLDSGPPLATTTITNAKEIHGDHFFTLVVAIGMKNNVRLLCYKCAEQSTRHKTHYLLRVDNWE